MKKNLKMMKNSEKKKRKLVKDSDEADERKRPKLSTITTSVNWDLRSILSDPETAFEPLKNFLSLNVVKKGSGDDEDDEAEKENEAKSLKSPIEIFEDACDSFIEESPEFVHLFTLLEKWGKKNSELKMALELFDALLHRLLAKRRARKTDEAEGKEEEAEDEDDDESERVQFALQFSTVSKRLLQDQSQVFYKLMDNRNNAAQIKAALKTLTTVTAGGPAGVRLILDHLDLTHPNFPTLLDRRDKRDEKDVRLRFILLLVGLLVNGDGKSSERLLETKGFVQNFFAGLLHDSSSTIFLLLAVFKERILENPAVSKSHKIKIFHEKTLKDLAALLAWRPGIEATPRKWNKEAKKQQREREAEATKEEENEEMSEETLQVRTSVADFLRFLLTNAKQGIVFKREDRINDFRHFRFQTSDAVARDNPNHLVTVFFKSLHRPFSNGLNRRLALDVLVACPDQIVHFLQHHSHVFVPRPTELWHSATKFLVELVRTLPFDAAAAVAETRIDEGLEDEDGDFVDACVPKQFFVGANCISIAGLKHPDPAIVSESLRFLGAVLERSNKIISAAVASSTSPSAASSKRDSLARAIAKILPSPSRLVTSTSFGSGNLAVQARQDLPRTLECLDQLISALSEYSKLTAQAFVEDDCAEVYRVLTMTAFLCGESERDNDIEKNLGKSVKEGNDDEANEKVDETGEGDVKVENGKDVNEKVYEMCRGEAIDKAKYTGEKVDEQEQQKGSNGGSVVATGKDEGEEETEMEESQVERELGLTPFDPPSQPRVTDPVQQQLKDILFALLRLFSVNGSLLPQMIKSTSSGNNSPESSKSILTQFMRSMTNPGRSTSTAAASDKTASEDIREFLIAALTSQSYLKEAAVEIGIWFRHLMDVSGIEQLDGNGDDGEPRQPTSSCSAATSPRDLIINFLDKSLCRLINHPYPFMDEVMDFQAEAESEGILDLNSDSASESASVASADSIIDAVLSVDPFDENLDKDVLESTVDEMMEADAPFGSHLNSLEDETGVDTTLALPFSPIVTAAFAEMKHNKDFQGKPALDRFVSDVLHDLFHIQADGKALGLFLKKQNNEEAVLRDDAILALVKFYHPHILSSVETENELRFDRVRELLLSAKLVVDSEVSKIADSKTLLQTFFQAGFHVFQLVDRVSLLSTTGHSNDGLDASRDITSNWKVKLPRLFKILHSCLRSLSSFPCQKRETDLILSRIFQHPTISRWFLRCPDRKSRKVETEESLSYEVTVGVAKCLHLASQLKNVEIGDRLVDLSSKAVSAFETYYDKDATFPSKLFKEALNVVLDNFAPHVSRKAVADVCRLLCARPMTEFISGPSNSPAPWEDTWDPADQSVKLSALGKRLLSLVEILADANVSLPPPDVVRTLGDVYNSVSFSDDLARVTSAMKSLLRSHPSLSVFVDKNTVHKLIKRHDEDDLIPDILPFSSMDWSDIFEFVVSKKLDVKRERELFEQIKNKNVKGMKNPFSWMWKTFPLFFSNVLPVRHDYFRFNEYVLAHLFTSDDDDIRDYLRDVKSVVAIDHRYLGDSFIYELCDITIADSASETDTGKKVSAQVDFLYALAHRSVFVDEAKMENISYKPKYSASQLIGRYLKFLVRSLNRGEEGRENSIKMFKACTYLLDIIEKGSGLERPGTLFQEPLWTSKLVKKTLKTYLKSSAALEFVQRLVHFYDENDASSSIRPSQLFSMLVSHSEFVEALLNPADENDKASLVSLIAEILPLTPEEDFEDESAPKLIKAFTSAYSASLSQSDQNIFAILAKFDTSKSGPLKPSLWGKALLEQQSVKQDQEASLWKSEVTMESVLNALDPEMMERTVNRFPVFRMLDPIRQKSYRTDWKKKAAMASSAASSSSLTSASSSHSQMYDPGFLLPLLLEFLSPSQLFNVKKFVQRRCLAFLFAATSSHFASVRLTAYAALGRFDRHLEGSRFAERNLYRQFLALLKHSIEKPGARLPSIVSAFFARASVILLSPEDDMYCDVCNFILLKPVMDLSQIPEFYRLFNSSNPLKFVKDRLWMLELMRDGLVETWDYIIFEKRQAIKTIQSLLLSDLAGETSVKITVTSLEILREAVKIPRACFEMVLDHDFLSTLAMLMEKYKNLNLAFKVVVGIFVEIWKTIRTKADKLPKNIDSLASAYCRAILLCLPLCLRSVEDTDSLISLLESLTQALERFFRDDVRHSLLESAPLESLVEFGLSCFQHQHQQQQHQRGRLVTSILDVVQLTYFRDKRDIRDKTAEFLRNACNLLIKSWLNCGQRSLDEEKKQRECAVRFFEWFDDQLPEPQPDDVMSETSSSDEETTERNDPRLYEGMSTMERKTFLNDFLRVYEKISSASYDDYSRDLTGPWTLCAKAMLRFGTTWEMKDFVTNLADM